MWETHAMVNARFLSPTYSRTFASRDMRDSPFGSVEVVLRLLEAWRSEHKTSIIPSSVLHSTFPCNTAAFSLAATGIKVASSWVFRARQQSEDSNLAVRENRNSRA